MRTGNSSTSTGVQPLLWRVAEAAILLGISRSQAYELIASGVLPHVKIGTSIRVPARALEEWVALQEQAASTGNLNNPTPQVMNTELKAA